MPEYIYENPETKEQISVFQSVHEAHEYEVDGVAYDRVYTIPHASIDTKIDANSESDFVEKTKAKTYGELWDHSAEMSSRRKQQNQGKDPVKQKFFDKNSKKRGGKKHIDDR
tara:strand:+ start:382 stop:717 length:336 start_codon:yes stop_codon:yes gene_type:complete